MKKLYSICIMVIAVLAIACNKTKIDAASDTNKIFTGVVVRNYSPECISTSGMDTPPYIIKVTGYEIDSFITMSLPNQYRIEGKVLKFKITDDISDYSYLVCNTSIIMPTVKKIFDITE